MVRRGLNCTLSYAKAEVSPAYRIRVSRVSYGFTVLAEESQARTTRAMYPRNRTAPTEFGLMIDLPNRAERNSFNSYLMRYYEYILDAGNDSTTFSTMTVDMPSRNFRREGVPKNGAAFGARLGEMLWRPVLTFETAREPSDWTEIFKSSITQLDLANNTDPATQFFYPTGVQLYGSQAAAVQAAINGVPTPASSALSDDAQQIFSDAIDAIEGVF